MAVVCQNSAKNVEKQISANEALLETLMDADSAESCSDSELDLDNSNTDPNYLSSGDRKSRSCHRKKNRIDVYNSKVLQ